MKLCFSLLLVLATVSAQAQLKLTFQFVGMVPHVGQTGYIRLVDNSTGKEVVSVRETIPSPDYTVVLTCLTPGRSYNVDFYADMNMNGVYNSPPADHAWRRTIDVVDTDVPLGFMHNTQFTDISFPNDPPVTTNTIVSEWSGNWHNLSFSTTGPGSATLSLNGATNSMNGSITMVGAFGSPTPVTISGTGPWDQVNDSVAMAVDAPLTGTLYFVRGTVHGTLTYASLGVNMDIDGNYGADQIMFSYVMSGAFTANGWMILNKDQQTDVAEELSTSSSLVYPTPANDVATITWNPLNGQALQILCSDLIGNSFGLPIQATEDGKVIINAAGLANGLYVVNVLTASSLVNGLLVK